MALSPIGGIPAVGSLNAAAGATPSISGVGGTGLAAETQALPGAANSTDPSSAGPGSFVDSLGQAFGNLNSELVGADAAMADFAAGGSADLHTVLLQMQEASLSLKLGVQVRDRLLEAYQQIMQMQL